MRTVSNVITLNIAAQQDEEKCDDRVFIVAKDTLRSSCFTQGGLQLRKKTQKLDNYKKYETQSQRS